MTFYSKLASGEAQLVQVNAMATIIIVVSPVPVFSAQRLNRGRLPGP